MPRLINPVDWSLVAVRLNDRSSPLVSLANSKGHQFHIQPVGVGLIRVIHSLPSLSGHFQLRNHGRGHDVGIDGFVWEKRQDDWYVDADEKTKRIDINQSGYVDATRGLRIRVDYSYTVTLSWFWADGVDPFLTDFKSAYTYDARTQRVFHQVSRQQSYMPLSEHCLSANDNDKPQKKRFEYIYGLGETKGPMMKDGKRYIMDARDSLGADPQETDPLYKLCPFYLHYNSNTKFWYGLYYNTLSPSIFDFSGEHDFATGEFRSFSAEAGPLDYYLLLGFPKDDSNFLPTMPSIMAQLARLVTPYSSGPAGFEKDGWQASPTLPPLNQFGYLASSLTLSERKDAQKAVVDYVKEARAQGFPIDSMHLSSGYAVDSLTGERNYFCWDLPKYPDPAGLGRQLEKELHCKVIINVKPWLLETHPSYVDTARASAFVRAAPDARPASKGDIPQDLDRCATYDTEPARTMHWSKGMGVTGKGSYFDFSAVRGCREWHRLMSLGVLSRQISHLWIDNNEFSSLVDDEEEIAGEIDLWSIPSDIGKAEADRTASHEVASRMGWGRRSVAIGSVGRAVLTMGMARATFEHLYRQLGNQRPVVVTRSAVLGMQAFAHATWSGDNSTSWLSLRWSTKLTLSFGLSFGLGLYGHDVGGFAGLASPSPELLIRWCQQSQWHTRFTIHSWKKISTTPWMYGKEETDVLRNIIRQRYRLIPMLYSLYVTHYHRHGWPVIKAMLWYHSQDFACLTIDEQFLVGSHVLIAPVCEYGKRQMTVYLPSLVDENGIDDACWYELEEGKWHQPSRTGHEVTVAAPLDRLPTLVREGGMIVLGPPIESHIPLPAPLKQSRTIQLYPSPSSMLMKRSKGQSTSEGQFTLFEDDGVTNDAGERGAFTEMTLHYSASAQHVEVWISFQRTSYAGEWSLSFESWRGDDRPLKFVVRPETRDGNVSVVYHAETSSALVTVTV